MLAQATGILSALKGSVATMTNPDQGDQPYYDGVHDYPVKPPPSAESKARRRSAAKVASNTRWAHEPDRVAATQAARDGMQRKFEDEVDPDRVLDPAERARRSEYAKSAYFTRLARKSADARRARKAKP